MAVELWIDDGTPWYLSPDIWVVPSDDPNDPPGVPFEGISAYVWANVHNRGTTAVSNATVRYYWADPSTMITRSTANLIGTSSVSLAPGETKPVLCITPWIPAIVNDGHECLIAEAFAGSDPLPPHGPNDPFNVAADRHVAQRNITVGQAAASMMFMHAFIIGNAGGREKARRTVRVVRAPMETLKPLARSIGLARLPKEAPAFDRVGLTTLRCGERPDDVGKATVPLDLAVGQRARLTLRARVPERFPTGTAALFLIEQMEGKEVVGGVAVLVTPPDRKVGDRRAGVIASADIPVKAATRKKATRKKATRKKATRKKATRKKGSAKKAAAKRPAVKKAAAKKATTGTAAKKRASSGKATTSTRKRRT